MIRLLTAVFLFASFHVVAEVTLTPLNNNTPADADDVMGNFNALNEALPPSDCTADQIIKWDGSAWVCADRSQHVKSCATYFCQVDCAEGTTVISGSCSIRTLTLDTYLWGFLSKPASNSGGWYCEGMSEGAVSWSVQAYAICQ